jgi:CO dehydrogenase maturation factor
MSTEGKKIAVTGKGGSGKTVLTALMTKLLSSRKELKVLAIDADSTLSLPYTLGIPIGKTVGDLRQSMIEDPEVKADVKSKHIREVMAEILETGKGFQILTMGRPEGPGCYCSVNDLLKYGIDTLSSQFDITLIDCEAGPEQVNRRVVQGLDVLIIVTDPTMRGMQAARVINQVAQTHESTQTALVINKVRDDIGVLVEKARDWDLNVLGCLPADDNIAEYDLSGRPILGLPNDSPAVVAVQEILQSLGL